MLVVVNFGRFVNVGIIASIIVVWDKLAQTK